VIAGMRLTCAVRFTGVDEKIGSKGRMELLRQQIEGRDDTGRLVFVAGRTTVYRSIEQVESESLK
jgi:hypothetical protein